MRWHCNEQKRVLEGTSRYNAMFTQKKLELVQESSEIHHDVCSMWLVAEHNQIKSLIEYPCPFKILHLQIKSLQAAPSCSGIDKTSSYP